MEKLSGDSHNICIDRGDMISLKDVNANGKYIKLEQGGPTCASDEGRIYRVPSFVEGPNDKRLLQRDDRSKCYCFNPPTTCYNFTQIFNIEQSKLITSEAAHLDLAKLTN